MGRTIRGTNHWRCRYRTNVLDYGNKRKGSSFFEQSGTFKNEFIKLGIPAEDYDIQNNFGETDNVIDLFAEIEKGYANEPSIFDKITKDDLIIAFFPCIYFCDINEPLFRLDDLNYKNLTLQQKYNKILDRAKDRERFFEICIKMTAICDCRGLRLVIENPYSQSHYLVKNFVYKCSFVDKNRQLRGDYFVKPTQYWFIHCKPTFGCSYTKPKETKTICGIKGSKQAGLCGEERSMISPDYARNFICDFILGKEQTHSQLNLFNNN